MNRRDRRRQESLGENGPQPSAVKAVNAAKARVRAAENRLEAGDTQGAVAALKEAQTLDPENPRAWYLTAMIAFNAHKIAEAGEAILNASLYDDKDPAIHANCSAIMNLNGRPLEAEASARFAISLAPDMPEAHCNLGVALESQGKITEAREALIRAKDLKPGYADALLSLGNLWFRAGDYMSAMESFAEAVKSGPGNVMAKTNLAIALRHLGELVAAEQQCMEAIALDQSYAEAHNALGNVHLQLGDVPNAIKDFEAALQRREGGYAEAHANLADARFKAGDYEGAEQAYLDVLERHPTFAEAAQGLGVVMLAQGRFEDAERRMRRAVEIRPGFGEAWANIADLKGDALTEADLKVLRERSVDARLAEEDRIAFLFALGKAEHALGHYDVAFKAYKDANERRRHLAIKADAVFDADSFEEEINNVINIIDGNAIKLHEDMGDAEAEMVFVCGMPRSGTTLVEQIIAAHPAVTGSGDVDILSGLPEAYPDDVPLLTAEQIRVLADTYLARLPVPPRDGRKVTDRTPQNVFFLGLVQVLFPKAKIIHCRRDPRDVALSCYFQNFRGVGLDWTSSLEDIRRYGEAEQRIMAHWRTTLDLAIHDIAYEDLVADPEAEARRLIDFLGLEWDPAVASAHEGTSTVLGASNWQVRKPVYTSAVGKWQSYAGYLSDNGG